MNKNEIVKSENDIINPVDVEGAVAFWENYQELTEKLLDKSDYQGKKFKKKSAWRKYATAFNISDEIIKEEITTDKAGRIIKAVYHVKATLPNGRQGIGVGSLSIFSKQTSEDESPFVLRQKFSDAEHDIPATAHTRAKNRAISDLIGAGEVSAEEIDNKDSKKVIKKQKPVKKTSPKKSEERNDNVQEAEYTKKQSKKISLNKDQEIELSKNKVINEAINRLKGNDKTLTKKGLVDEVQNLLGEQAINTDESNEARKIIMSA